MYDIDDKTKICFKHVVRIEKNERNNTITFQMDNGLNAVKECGTKEGLTAEFLSAEQMVDSA